MSRRTHLNEREQIFVQQQRVARLATADEMGHPHVVPVCYAFDGARFYTPLDEKPKRVEVRQLRRVRNIEARHEAALLIDRYADDWSQLGYVLVEGQAELLSPEALLHERAVLLLRERYPQYRAMALEQRPIIMITPWAISSWGPALQTANA